MEDEKIPIQTDRDNKSKRQADVEINLSQKRMQAIIELKFKAIEVSRSNTDDDVKKAYLDLDRAFNQVVQYEAKYQGCFGKEITIWI